jgi:hypothetical protein
MTGIFDNARNPDGTYDGTKAMAAVTGMPRDEIVKLAQIARENVAKLSVCTGHAFEAIGPIQPLRTRYRCANCGGDVDSSAYRWYTQGRAHEAARK